MILIIEHIHQIGIEWMDILGKTISKKINLTKKKFSSKTLATAVFLPVNMYCYKRYCTQYSTISYLNNGKKLKGLVTDSILAAYFGYNCSREL